MPRCGETVTIGGMSEDWLVISPRPIDVEDLLLSLQVWSGRVTLRVDATQRCTVIVDHHDNVLLWVGPSQPAHDPVEALERAHLAPVDGDAAWWTEVIQPATPHTDRGSLIGAATVARALADVAGGATQCLSTTSCPRTVT